MPFVERLVDEMKTRPFTMIMLLGVYAILTLSALTNYGLASEQQVQGIAAQVQAAAVQVATLSNTVKRSGLDGRIDQKRAELFNLQQKVNELNATKKPVDQLYLARINELTQEISDLQKERDSLK